MKRIVRFKGTSIAQVGLTLCAMALLVGCQSGPHITAETTPSPQSPASVQPSAATDTGGNAPTASTSPEQVATRPPTQPTANTLASAEALRAVQSLSLQIPTRFLNARGESTVLQVLLKDASGKVLNPDHYPLVWQSSRSGDMAVDPSGRVTALVEFGYSQISVQLTGTHLKASEQISVNGPAGSGLGSNASRQPVYESISATGTFEF